MFQIVAVPIAAHRGLPTANHRWVMTCLSAYADRNGRCWPTMRQLAADARMSLSSVCRRLGDMARLGCFTRVRQGRGRYVYTLAEAFRPRWEPRVSAREQRVPQGDNQNKHYKKQICHTHGLEVADDTHKWEARMRGWAKRRFWLPYWGPKPNEPGCFAPTVSWPASQGSTPPRGRPEPAA